MTLQMQRRLILLAALVIAAVLAFPLRETVYKLVVIPAAFIAFNLNLVYRSYSQAIWWLAVVFIVLFMLVFSLVPRGTPRSRAPEKRKPPQGPVEALAVSLGKAQRGIYFKWVVANRLGKLAYQMLVHRESGRPRSVFTPLVGIDWEPSKDLQTYLETGLHGSFADFPNAQGPLGSVPKTPLDLDITEAVEFLESQMQNGHLPHKS